MGKNVGHNTHPNFFRTVETTKLTFNQQKTAEDMGSPFGMGIQVRQFSFIHQINSQINFVDSTKHKNVEVHRLR